MFIRVGPNLGTMSVGEVSRERVEQRLVALDDVFDSFPVNQTTLTVSPDAYQHVRERCRDGLVDAYVQVYDDGEVLLGDGTNGETGGDEDGSGGDPIVPNVEPDPGESIVAGVRREVDAQTGVECTLTSLERVTILGVCRDDADDPDTVYRLVVVFAADAVNGSTAGGYEWAEGVPDSALPRH